MKIKSFIPILLLLNLIFASSLHADILEKAEVQSRLFGEGAFDFNWEEGFGFQTGLITSQKSAGLSVLFLRKLNSRVRAHWGISFEDEWDHEKVFSGLGGVLLVWDEYIVEPFVGVQAGMSSDPDAHRNLFSQLIVGLEYNFQNNLGVYLRETWKLANTPLHVRQPIAFKLEDARAELGLYWRL